MRKLLLLAVFILSLMVSVSALPDCFLAVHDVPQPGFEVMGYVSLQGHYAEWLNSSLILYPYGLFCDERLVQDRTDVSPTFVFSDPNEVVAVVNGLNVYGGGHVSFSDNKAVVNFTTPAYHGFAEGKCRVATGGSSCTAQEVCVLKVSNPDQGTVADCNDANLPYENTFQNRICCTPTEYCRDGIDNTGDGLIDCASPECHQSPVNPEPLRCDPDPSYVPGNQQTTLECVIGHDGDDNTIYNESCEGPDPDPFVESGWNDINNWPSNFPEKFDYPDVTAPYYCSYGIDDDGSHTEGQGFCCPPDTRAEYEEGMGWICIDFEECGVSPILDCDADHRTNFQGWLDLPFDGEDKEDFCVSHLPNYFSRITDTYDRSMGCCFVYMYGQAGFYYAEDNVKIFGYE